jgi:hypothetical protein
MMILYGGGSASAVFYLVSCFSHILPIDYIGIRYMRMPIPYVIHHDQEYQRYSEISMLFSVPLGNTAASAV